MTQTPAHARLPIVISFVMLLFLLFGCLDTGLTASQGNDNFNVTFRSSKKCAEPNEIITLQARVANRTTETKIIELADRPVFDIVIGNPDSGAIRWSDGKPLAEVNRLELSPGESKSIEMQWVSDGITPVGAWFVSYPRSPDIVMSPGFIIPLTNRNCPGPFGP